MYAKTAYTQGEGACKGRGSFAWIRSPGRRSFYARRHGCLGYLKSQKCPESVLLRVETRHDDFCRTQPPRRKGFWVYVH